MPVVLSSAARACLRAMLEAAPGRAAGDVRDTGSMRPSFDERSIVVVEQTPWTALRMGDVVLFSHWSFGPETVAHRIVARSSQRLRTRGDACRLDDGFDLSPRDYHGYRVIAAIDKATGAINWQAPER